MARTEKRVRVLVADDHAYTRAGVRSALEADGFEVCAEAATGRQAVLQAQETRPDVALLDVHMPDGSGVDAARELTRTQPETAVVMLSYSRADDDLVRALQAGASGYLLKDMDPTRLGISLRNVLAGEAVLPRSAMSALAGHLGTRSPAAAATPQLTPREREVAALLREHASTDDIAAQLSMSPTTVRVHIKNIMDKLGVATRADASEKLAALQP